MAVLEVIILQLKLRCLSATGQAVCRWVRGLSALTSYRRVGAEIAWGPTLWSQALQVTTTNMTSPFPPLPLRLAFALDENIRVSRLPPLDIGGVSLQASFRI